MAEETPRHEQPPEAVAAVATGPAERALASAFRTVFSVLRVVMVVVLVALAFANTRFLQQNQRAVILRFGKIVGTGAGRVRGPGLVFAWPQPVDEIIIVDAGRIQALELDDFMYRPGAREGGTESLGGTLDPARDGYTLTGDANIIHTIWRVEYQIDDVVKYALKVENPEALIRRALAAAVVHTSSEFTVEEALWGAGMEMRRRVWRRLQERLDEADSGIEVVGVRTPARQEPKQTTEAFLRSAQAAQEVSEITQGALRYREALLAAVAGDAAPELAEKLAELAQAEQAPENERDEATIAALRNEVAELLERAGGEVATILSEAETYRTKVVADAASMAQTFDALDQKYQENPTVFIRQTYQNAIEQVLSQAGVKFVLYPRDREWRIVLEPRKKKPKEHEAPVVERTKEERMRERIQPF